MENSTINALSAKFYNAVSFRHNHLPSLHTLEALFYGRGVMVNNTFAEPITFTAESFIAAIQSQIATGDIKQFHQRELSGRTEMFGRIAQRISIYEYNFSEIAPERWPRGVNYMQLVQIGAEWKILSMTWADENESYLIPEEYLSFLNS